MITVLSQATTPVNLVPWEYGIAVGVIVLSSGLIWKLITTGLEKLESISNAQSEAIKTVTVQHREERKEWNEDARRREDRITSVCDELIEAISTQRNSAKSDS